MRKKELELLDSLRQLARLVVRKANTSKGIRIEYFEDESDSEPETKFLEVDGETHEQASHLSSVLYSVADLSGAEPEVLLLAAGALLARLGALHVAEDEDANETSRQEDAVMLAVSGLVLGNDVFASQVEAELAELRDANEDEEEEDEQDEEDTEVEDDLDLSAEHPNPKFSAEPNPKFDDGGPYNEPALPPEPASVTTVTCHACSKSWPASDPVRPAECVCHLAPLDCAFDAPT